MALSENYRQEYYNKLKETLDIIGQADRYREVSKRYDALKGEIDALLAAADAFCVDSERYIDKETGRLREDLGFNLDPAIAGRLEELCALYREKQRFAVERGWDDDLYVAALPVIAIAEYEKMEKEIISELGRDAGEAVIYEVKRQIAEYERSIGMCFFADAVERVETIFKIRVLCPSATELPLDRGDGYGALDLELTNDKGERIRFRKTGQILHEDALYVELVLLEDMPISPPLRHYKVDQCSGGLMLLLVEDKELSDVLFDKIEALII